MVRLIPLACPTPKKKRKLNSSRGFRLGNTYDSKSSSGFKLTSGENFTEGAKNEREDSAPRNHPEREPTKHQPFKKSTNAENQDLLSLQVNELLGNLEARFDTCLTEAESDLRLVIDAIERLPPKGPILAAEAEILLRKQSDVQIPFPKPLPTAEVKYTFEYARPEDIEILGNLVVKTMFVMEDMPIVDVVLTIPSHILQGKDYLNHRYFYKRAYYIACVAAGLSETFAAPASMNFGQHEGNFLQPVLTMSRPFRNSNDGSTFSGYQVRITATAPCGFFPVNKILPWRNSLRSEASSSGSPRPTPFYNSTLCLEMSIPFYSSLLSHVEATVQAFSGASTLVAIWLRQHAFDSSIPGGGFGAFESSIMMAILLQKGGPKGRPVLNANCSPFQLFRTLLLFLATRDLTQSPLVLDVEQGSMSEVPRKTPIFLDGMRGVNLLSKMTEWSYSRLRHEASTTLSAISSSAIDSFKNCFVIKADSCVLKYDYTLQAVLPPSLPIHPSGADSKGYTLDTCERIYTILKTALTDRAHFISLSLPLCQGWSLKGTENRSEPAHFEVHIITNPEHVHRTIDRGPSIENKDVAAAFRQFWGSKAELRRFKDGSITESLVWSPIADKESTMVQVIQYSLARHLGNKLADSIKFQLDGFGELILASKNTQHTFAPSWEAFESLKRHIYELDGLPLQVRQISPASAELRLASLHMNGAEEEAKVPAGVILQFESSGRWPDNLAAVQRTKVALLLKLADLLERKDATLRTRVGLESPASQLLDLVFLDVKIAGYCFRLRVYHDRELILLERQLSSSDATPSTREVVANWIAVHKATYMNQLSHTQMVRNLCLKFPCLSPTIRLLKRWCSCHLLFPHLEEELIELLAIGTFTQPYPYDAPGSLKTGFLRTIFRLAQWNWRTEPMFVNLADKLTNAEIDSIQTHFDAWRKIDPAMNRIVLVVGSQLDQASLITQRRPNKLIASRLTALAGATITSAMSKENYLPDKPLFATPMQQYDFVIYIDRKRAEKEKDLVDTYVNELKLAFGDGVVFMHDGLEKAVIAGLWNPAAGPRSWKVNTFYSTLPYNLETGEEQPPQISINKAAMLHEMARLGGDLVSSVKVQRSLTT